MKKKGLYQIMAAVFFCMVFCYNPAAIAQVKIGNNPKSINKDAVVEMESTNKGLLLPRLALSATTNAAPLSSFVQGMFVFNTATLNDVTPGMYYSDGAKWIKVNPAATATTSNGWNLNGNSGTVATKDFIGTTDNAPLVIKTNGAERVRINENGWVGIGTSTPTAALQVRGQLVIDTLTTGNKLTDNLLVANPADGKVKMIPVSSFTPAITKRLETVIVSGQTVFNTPGPINDVNKIALYRNGVQISFTVINTNSIAAEVPCVSGDEIRIIQLL